MKHKTTTLSEQSKNRNCFNVNYVMKISPPKRVLFSFVMKCVNDFQQFNCFIPPRYITEILLKVTLSTINQLSIVFSWYYGFPY